MARVSRASQSIEAGAISYTVYLVVGIYRMNRGVAYKPLIHAGA